MSFVCFHAPCINSVIYLLTYILRCWPLSSMHNAIYIIICQFGQCRKYCPARFYWYLNCFIVLVLEQINKINKYLSHVPPTKVSFAYTLSLGYYIFLLCFTCLCECESDVITDVEEMPFERRNVTIRRDKRFEEEFEIVDFLGRYISPTCMYVWSIKTRRNACIFERRLVIPHMFILLLQCRLVLIVRYWFTF